MRHHCTSLKCLVSFIPSLNTSKWWALLKRRRGGVQHGSERDRADWPRWSRLRTAPSPTGAGVIITLYPVSFHASPLPHIWLARWGYIDCSSSSCCCFWPFVNEPANFLLDDVTDILTSRRMNSWKIRLRADRAFTYYTTVWFLLTKLNYRLHK